MLRLTKKYKEIYSYINNDIIEIFLEKKSAEIFD